MKSLWDNLLKTTKKEISGTKKIPTGGGTADIKSGMNLKILAIYGEDSTIFLGLEGVETNVIEVVSDIEISAIPVVIDSTNSAMPNTVNENRDNENNLGQIKCSSDHKYPFIKNEQPSSGNNKIIPTLHLSTIDMENYIIEEKLKLKEEVLKLQTERDYFISKKEFVDLEKKMHL